MTQNEQEKFSNLFTDALMKSDIQYANGLDGEAYVVYGESGILFNITYRKSTNKYIFGRTELFKSQYSKYGLSVDAVPDHKMVFESVSFAYKIRQVAQRAKKDYTTLYNDLLINSDIQFHKQGDFEVYIVYNSGFKGYAIGYNAETNKYGFKRYELMNTMYKVCDIAPDKKPDYAALYKRAKEYYQAQVVVESMRNFEIY